MSGIIISHYRGEGAKATDNIKRGGARRTHRHAVREHIYNEKIQSDVIEQSVPTRHGDFEFIDEPDYNVDSDVFLHSLQIITPEELGAGAVKHKMTGAELVSYIIGKAVFFAAVAVFLICVFKLAVIFIEQSEGDRYYENLTNKYSIDSAVGSVAAASKQGTATLPGMKPSEVFVAGVSQPDSGIQITDDESNEKVELMKASIASLARVNPDVYGWIYIEDTVIDYPVVRGDDNEYYLNHAFTGEPLSIGSVFADYRLRDYILDNYNTVFYGHNSSTGKMFADVMKFAQSEEFFNTHLIYVYTKDGLYVFEPFNMSMFQSDYQYFKTYFRNTESFVDFAETMQSESMYSKTLSFDGDDRILTLSTCTKTGIKSLRYCLQAKLIEIIE